MATNEQLAAVAARLAGEVFAKTTGAVKMHHATRAKYERLQATLDAEYPRLTVLPTAGEETDHAEYTHELGGWQALADGEVFWTGEKLPELADLLDTCAEAGIDPIGEEQEGDDGKVSRTVVPERYRQIYRESSSTGTTNGDWLAERLTAETTSALDGKLNTADLEAVFSNNGLDLTAPWAVNRSKGWQGRYRMSGRLVLEKAIALSGTYIGLTETVEVPADFVEAMRTKHRKWYEKQIKRAEA